MTEKQFYDNYFRPAFYSPPHFQVFRIEDYGMPDVMVVHEHGVRFFELKVLDHLPVREGTPFRVKYTMEQKRTLSSINEAAGKAIAFFLVAVAREREWFLFPSSVPTEMTMDEAVEAAVVRGTFKQLQQIAGGNDE